MHTAQLDLNGTVQIELISSIIRHLVVLGIQQTAMQTTNIRLVAFIVKCSSGITSAVLTLQHRDFISD